VNRSRARAGPLARALFALLAGAMLGSVPAAAMEVKRVGTTLVLTGEIARRDLDRVQAEFARPPAITDVVLRNSMGGNSWTGYRLGELFREKGVTTAVSGHCVSSCSRLFLGGRQRVFSDDFPAGLTYVGFHGHYDFDKLNLKAVEQNDQAGWTLRHTDGKADPALVQRWINIPERRGDMRFYRDAVRDLGAQPTVLCSGRESSRPRQCETVTTTALAQGIVTSNMPWRSPDAADLMYPQRELKYPTTRYATLAQVDRLPVRGASAGAARKDFMQFRDAALPRAFAVASDGSRWAWSANGAQSIDVALERCNVGLRAARSAARCVLYAVDERVVFSAGR